MNAKKMERFFKITSESSVTRPIIYWHKMQLKAYNGAFILYIFVAGRGKIRIRTQIFEWQFDNSLVRKEVKWTSVLSNLFFHASLLF